MLLEIIFLACKSSDIGIEISSNDDLQFTFILAIDLEHMDHEGNYLLVFFALSGTKVQWHH